MKNKIINWNNEKNQLLKATRNISFEEVIQALGDEKILAIIENANQEKYKNQFSFILELKEYAYIEPFVENEDEIFLKTVIPSRKMTEKYLNRTK